MSGSTAAPTMPFLSPEASNVVFHLVCPFLGGLVATAMFAAPIADLRAALIRQSLGALNPRPWAIMTGNCLGWCAYAYYTRNPFILASNLPGFILSLWLNTGAAKLQYKQLTTTVTTTVALNHGRGHRPSSAMLASASRHVDTNGEEEEEEEEDGRNGATSGTSNSSGTSTDGYYTAHHPPPTATIIFTNQEVWWLRVWMVWGTTLVWVGWVSPFPGYEATTVGVLVNLNLLFFYAAPLQMMSEVVRVGHSNSIHRPSMVMACANATFWLLYGIALWDPILMVPNIIGFALGLCQVVLCLWYPPRRTTEAALSVQRGLTMEAPGGGGGGGGGGLFRDYDVRGCQGTMGAAADIPPNNATAKD